MASLATLLESKLPVIQEEVLESGRIYSFQEGNVFTKVRNTCYVWCPTANGQAVIEIWGAGGSGAKMCCCGNGLPGNSGAYSRKTISVTPSNCLCMVTGFSCGNDVLCFRGCSDSTQLCWKGSDGINPNGCMCAEGGKGGVSICSTTPSMYCCFTNNGFCSTYIGDNCGIVCNKCTGDWIGCAYGGDVNRNSNIGCANFGGCYPSCICLFSHTIPLPAGMISECGAVVRYGMDSDNSYSNWSGQGPSHAIAMINGTGRNPGAGVPWRACFRNDTSCGCYEAFGCTTWMPYGVGGAGPQPCGGVRDHATRGGHGAIRIKFIES